MCRLLFAIEIFSVACGSRSYVCGLFLGTRAVAILGLRTRLGLHSGQVGHDPLSHQALGAYFLRSMLFSPLRTP